MCSLCPRAANYSADFLNSANWTSHYNSTTQSLLTAIKAATNFVVDEDDLDHFCDCLNTHYCHGLQWPTGMTSDLFHKLWAELAWQRYSMLKFPSVEENAKVGIGYLLRELWQVSSNECSCSINNDNNDFITIIKYECNIIIMIVDLIEYNFCDYI